MVNLWASNSILRVRLTLAASRPRSIVDNAPGYEGLMIVYYVVTTTSVRHPVETRRSGVRISSWSSGSVAESGLMRLA